MFLSRRRARWRAKVRKAEWRGYGSVDGRLPVSEAARGLLRKPFPDHWSFLLGELALYSFAVLLLTGVYLTLFFDPSMAQTTYTGSYEPLRGTRMSEAYASTLDISFDVRGGLLVRQVHHWAALLFVASAAVHMLRVFLTGAFRRPREVNWVIGVTLFVLAMVEGFSGYSLPDDLLSGTGLRIAHGIMLSIPVVGTYLAFFAFGGEYPGEEIIPRLYSLHILLVPGLLVGLITLHLILVVYHKHTQWAGPGRTGRNVVGQPMVPQFATKSTGLFFLVTGVLVLVAGLFQINPVWAYGPYRTDKISFGSQPDWYIGFLEGSLRLVPAMETTLWGHTIAWSVLLPAVVLPAVLFLLLYLYPFFERWVTGDSREHHLCDRPRDRPVRTGLGAAGATFYAVLLLAGGDDVIAHVLHVSLNGLVWVTRVALVVAPVLAFLVTKRLCLALRDRDAERLAEGEPTGEVVQSVEGAFHPGHRPLPEQERYTLLARARELPRPMAADGDAGPVRRLRTRLNHWYYRDAYRQRLAREEREVRELPPHAPGELDPYEPGASSRD
ncbi:ubiquinol-cytochrome c reductase cytochrome b subunit [Streptomyces carminius]|uniref:Cytochrome bc1 complex cytochrome b subunit n=1 Tax=Streptomyces carminius TaxID=2665496 RepID=A0A2M8M5V7_9ACTN|nr:ubiquinol-cytochrome c reductase cytochrome b subunit [Streptomyces carminius]PJE99587.1 ubiquinol-cytochrome c reductase cytochrome b subunit [Streptomyces carminius]